MDDIYTLALRARSTPHMYHMGLDVRVPRLSQRTVPVLPIHQKPMLERENQPVITEKLQLATEVSLSKDGEFVDFVAHWGDRAVRCAISRKALESYFWAPTGADEKQLLRVYLDGRKRIAVAIERRLLRKEGEPIVLRAEHFSG